MLLQAFNGSKLRSRGRIQLKSLRIQWQNRNNTKIINLDSCMRAKKKALIKPQFENKFLVNKNKIETNKQNIEKKKSSTDENDCRQISTGKRQNTASSLSPAKQHDRKGATFSSSFANIRRSLQDQCLQDTNFVKQNRFVQSSLKRRCANKFRNRRIYYSDFNQNLANSNTQTLANFNIKTQSSETARIADLQYFLKEAHMRNQRSLMGFNIPRIERQYKYSRYELHNLYSSFKALVKYANSDIYRLKRGFKAILQMNNVTLNDQIINKGFQSFCKSVSFQNFLKNYGEIHDLVFNQVAIEILKKLFIAYHVEQQLSQAQVISILKQKIQEEQAISIKNIFWSFWNKAEKYPIKVKQMFDACYHSKEICSKIIGTLGKKGDTFIS